MEGRCLCERTIYMRSPRAELHDLHKILSGPSAPPCDAGVRWSAVSPPSAAVSLWGSRLYPGHHSPCVALCASTALLRRVRSACVRVFLVGVVAL